MALAPGSDPVLGGDSAPEMGADDAQDTSDSNVLVTICKNNDGSYAVYSGDEPEEGASGDMAAGSDAGMMGGAAAAAPQGQPASSIGEALKAALDILNADKSSAGPTGSPDDQFAAGFGGQAAAPAGSLAQKY